MNIAMSFDNNYARYVPTLMNSIIINNKDVTFCFITPGLTKNNYAHINKYHDKIKWYDNDPQISDCNIANVHLESKAIFNMAYLATIMKDIDKVIYIDVDSIVLSNISELWEMETSDKGYCAVLDLRSPLMDMLMKRHTEGFQFPIDYDIPAFNNSVMVMDYHKMRDNQAESFMLDLLDKYRMTDMAFQNIYANGDFKQLDRKWCISANYYSEKEFRDIPIEDWKILTWHGWKPWGNGRIKNHWEKYRVGC